ncbi:Molybdate-anion transporter [Lamellibrachia satsuma]|nr:Molybdate-anion transporter [Lamellibrachia satsuma]
MTNQELYGSRPRITTIVRQRRLRLAGHVMRYDEAATKVLLWKPDGPRRRGRPTTTLQNILEKDTNLSGTNLVAAMKNRNLLKEIATNGGAASRNLDNRGDNRGANASYSHKQLRRQREECKRLFGGDKPIDKMNIFVACFWALCALCGVLFLSTRTALPSSTDPLFGSFQRTYLLVYLLAMAADWMQGPYVYALYDNYGMSAYDINVLFVCGFGSSMIVGTAVGSFADRYGRRTNCILYGVLYGLSCVTKHFNNFHILMVGRVLGGIATSILYSAFESWLNCEHHKRGFDADLIETIFSNAVLTNSLVAILSGVVAQTCADYFGYVAPFDVSFAVLAVMCVVIISTWSENYGDTQLNTKETFANAFQAIRHDPKVFCLGAIQSLFEGSMYTFVLLWTRVLTPPVKEAVESSPHLLSAADETDGHRGKIPHGIIFAAFMVAVMIGSSMFNLMLKFGSVESFMRPVFVLSALALAIPVILPTNRPLIYMAFIVFEVCVGIFWPSMGTMRSRYVPEATRATVMNIFRVPLNLIVIIILTQGFSDAVVFQCCVVFLLLAAAAQHSIYRHCETGTAKVPISPRVKEEVDLPEGV